MIHTPSANTATKPIKVLAIGMDGRKQAVFRTAFRLHRAERYHLMENEAQRPDLILVDVDGASGWHLAEICKKEYPDIPLLALTVRPANNPHALPVLQKPLRVETLFPKLRELINKPAAAIMPPTRSVRQPPAMPKVLPVSGIQQIERFDPNAGLLGQVLTLYRRKQHAVIGNAQQPLFILLSEMGVILLLQPLQKIKEACLESNGPLPQQILPLDQQFLSGPRVKIQALLWQIALWSAHGRLILNITPDTPLRLRHWPNLTRLAQTPNALRLSAFLTRTPVSLRLTHRMLGIPLPHIIDFIAATYAIELLEDPAELPIITPSVSIAAPVARQQQGNLLSRLLRKVIGL